MMFLVFKDIDICNKLIYLSLPLASLFMVIPRLFLEINFFKCFSYPL